MLHPLHHQYPWTSIPYRLTQATLLFEEKVSLTPPIGYVPQFLLEAVPLANEAMRPYRVPAYGDGSGFAAIKTSIKKGFMRVIVTPRFGCRGKRPLSNGSTGLAG